MVSRCCRNDIFIEDAEYPYYVCAMCYMVCELISIKGKHKMTIEVEAAVDVKDQVREAAKQTAEVIHEKLSAIFGKEPTNTTLIADSTLHLLTIIVATNVAFLIEVFENNKVLASSKDLAAFLFVDIVANQAKDILTKNFVAKNQSS